MERYNTQAVDFVLVGQFECDLMTKEMNQQLFVNSISNMLTDAVYG